MHDGCLAPRIEAEHGFVDCNECIELRVWLLKKVYLTNCDSS